MGDTSVLSGGNEGGNEAPVPASGGWVESFDDDSKSWISGMGLDKLSEREALSKVLPMYRGAEQKLGVPAEQLLRLPGKDAKPEDWRSVWVKLGAPDKPEGYEIAPPEGQGDEFSKVATSWFHEIGVPKGQAQALASKWNDYVAQQQTAQDAQFQSQADKDIAALREEWKGDEYNKNVALAQKVRRASGLSDEEALKVERALGLRRSAVVFSALGKSLGEHRFIGAGEGSQSFAMTPESAGARLAELRKDGAWMSKYLSGDADKMAEYTRLMQIAHPEPV